MFTRATFVSTGHCDISLAHLAQNGKLEQLDSPSGTVKPQQGTTRHGARSWLVIDQKHQLHAQTESARLYGQTLFGSCRLKDFIKQSTEALLAENKLPFPEPLQAEISAGKFRLHELGIAAFVRLEPAVTETDLLAHLHSKMQDRSCNSTNSQPSPTSVGIDADGATYYECAEYRITFQPAIKRLKQNQKFIIKKLGEEGLRSLERRLSKRYWVEVLFSNTYLMRHDMSSPAAWRKTGEEHFMAVLNQQFPAVLDLVLTSEQNSQVQRLKLQDLRLVRLYQQGGDVREKARPTKLAKERQLILEKTGIDISAPLPAADKVTVRISGKTYFNVPAEARALFKR